MYSQEATAALVELGSSIEGIAHSTSSCAVVGVEDNAAHEAVPSLVVVQHSRVESPIVIARELWHGLL